MNITTFNLTPEILTDYDIIYSYCDFLSPHINTLILKLVMLNIFIGIYLLMDKIFKIEKPGITKTIVSIGEFATTAGLIYIAGFVLAKEVKLTERLMDLAGFGFILVLIFILIVIYRLGYIERIISYLRDKDL